MSEDRSESPAPAPPPLDERRPRISLVTPSFNQASTVEATLASVLNQGYPNLEYIVVDGGSTDGSVEILRRYEDRLAALVIEPDRGHAHALNKGFALSTGEILGWINSDDLLLPGSLSLVAELFRLHSDMEWLTSAGCELDPAGRIVAALPPTPWSRARFLTTGDRHIQQESTFWRRSLWERAGGALSEEHLACDFELWARFFRHARLFQTRGLVGAFRHQPGQRSVSQRERYVEEMRAILRRERAHPELESLPDAEAETYSVLYYDVKEHKFERRDSPSRHARLRELLAVDLGIASELLVLNFATPPWDAESTDWIEGLFPEHPRREQKRVPFCWLGSGEREGLGFSLVAERNLAVNLRFRVAPGPSRLDRLRTVRLLAGADGSRREILRTTIESPGRIDCRLSLLRGDNPFAIEIVERPSENDLPAYETRALLAAVSDFLVS